MKLNFLTAGAALAGAVAMGTLTTAPAQAFSIGIDGTATIAEGAGTPPASTSLTFQPILVPGTGVGSGVFDAFDDADDSVVVNPLNLIWDGVNYGLAQTESFLWKTYTDAATGDVVTFNLNPTSAKWTRFFDPNDGDLAYEQVGEFTGTYLLPGGQTASGTGILNVSRSGLDGVPVVEMTQRGVTPVPTPALLPGLIGMGVAALRKRKEAVEETVAS